MQDHQLGISRVVVYVRMQLRVPYGRAVYVVGNSEEIGRWDVAKAHRLTWTPVPMISILGGHLAWIFCYSDAKSSSIQICDCKLRRAQFLNH